jgi:hypothetical protein
MRRAARWWIFGSLLAASMRWPEARACSCAWRGPFLAVAPEARVVVRGRPIEAAEMDALETLALDELRERLAAALEPPQARRAEAHFAGEIQAGQRFERNFGQQRWVFALEPSDLGWTVTVRERGREEDLSRLTPPLHGVPNPRDIEGWHFRNADNTGPNEPGEKNVNAPGETREFIFSPEVGRTIAGPGATEAVKPEQVEKVRSFGRGELTIVDYELDRLEPGARAAMRSMRFEVVLSWSEPASAGPRGPCRPRVRPVPSGGSPRLAP